MSIRVKAYYDLSKVNSISLVLKNLDFPYSKRSILLYHDFYSSNKCMEDVLKEIVQGGREKIIKTINEEIKEKRKAKNKKMDKNELINLASRIEVELTLSKEDWKLLR